MIRIARALALVAAILPLPGCSVSLQQLYEQETLEIGRAQRAADATEWRWPDGRPLVEYRTAAVTGTTGEGRRSDSAVVYFDVGCSSIDADGERALRSFVHDLQARPETLILVEGFADGTGVEAADAGLSDQRARVVADFLRGEGVPAARLASHGIQPGDASITPPDRLSNRRADVRVR